MFVVSIFILYSLLLYVSIEKKINQNCNLLIDDIRARINCYNGTCVDVNSTYRCDYNQ